MVSDYFHCTTFHLLSDVEQMQYQRDGVLTVRSLYDGADIGRMNQKKQTKKEKIVNRDNDVYQNHVRITRNRIAPRRSYDLKAMLKCIEVIEEVVTDEGTMFTMTTEYAGQVDVEVLATRYVLHFDSQYRHYIMNMLASYQIPHTRNIDGHTTEVLRMEKQKRDGLPWWKK